MTEFLLATPLEEPDSPNAHPITRGRRQVPTSVMDAGGWAELAVELAVALTQPTG